MAELVQLQHPPPGAAGRQPGGPLAPEARAPDFSRLIRSPQAEQNDSTPSQAATAASGSGVRKQRSSTIRTIRTRARRWYVLLQQPHEQLRQHPRQGVAHRDVASHQSFTEHHGLTVPLLADVDHEVGRAYGVSAPVIGTRRAAFIVDEDGIVRYRVVHRLGLDFQSADDLAEALDALPSRA